ncbi:MAG: hypothetical protein ACYC2R_01500 [Burkholderiales bacterium]
MRRILFLLILLTGIGHGAELPGRLFFSAEERAALDAARLKETRSQDGHAAASPTLTLDGLVRRSGGKSTVWINGVAHSIDDLPANGKLQPDGVSLQTPRRRVTVKAGQTVDIEHGTVNEEIKP